MKIRRRSLRMDYGKAAKAVYEQIGGRDNIISAAHCATRLRLVIADNSKCDKTRLEEIDGVKGVFDASGQLRSFSEPGRSIRFMMNLSAWRGSKRREPRK